MRRILKAVGFLLILVTACGGCQDRRKDRIPTPIAPLPRDQQPLAHDKNPD